MRTAVLFVLAASVAGCGLDSSFESQPTDDQPSADDEEGGDYVPLPEKADGVSWTRGPLRFDAACAPGDRLTIAAVGDVLLHGPLQTQAHTAPDRFRSLWAEVEPRFAAADLTYANLEGPTAGGITWRLRDIGDPGLVFTARRSDGSWPTNAVYTSYSLFNYHPSLIEDLLDAGVDVVSTANNHSLDRGSVGIDRTIDALEAAGLPFTGTRRAGEDDRDRPWVTYTTTAAPAFRVAWVACTYGTNGIRDRQDQVLDCWNDTAELLSVVAGEAARPEVDAVFVTPHWGLEYHAAPEVRQMDLAHELLEAGALAVIGAHPHVLQPWERHVTGDGREGFVIYSLGNFVSGQSGLAKRTSIALHLGLVRGADGRTRLQGARYVPLYMDHDDGVRVRALDWRGEAPGPLSDALAHALQMYGAYNVMRPDEALVVDPQCDPAWSPPQVGPRFIGDACTADSECDFAADAFCHDAGFCTLPCDGLCPDLAGRASTFCADVGADSGICVSRAVPDNGWCEGVPNTTVVTADRFIGRSGARPATADVCLP